MLLQLPGFCIRGSISFGKLRSQAVGGAERGFWASEEWSDRKGGGNLVVGEVHGIPKCLFFFFRIPIYWGDL